MPLSTLVPFALVAVIGILCFMQRTEPELEVARPSFAGSRRTLRANGRAAWPTALLFEQAFKARSAKPNSQSA